ncbi:two-component regulator propeller domain-containing protein [Pedobacter miscanthi]|uniref:hybrid sensor histidine kinase/response regulator transcription factor n=1 Tax=Pedobacter miscanthi TaxID=2259170 RepID=UPI00292D0442|nr:two-component regulator propeller domain-containing protein [Pedobacter miscanthi]
MLFLLLLFPFFGYSQKSSYYFKRYQIEDGLSSNTVGSICQDKNGFMWFGTPNGLNRFDGSTFKVFLNNPTDSQSLGSNRIVSLCEADKLYVGTANGIFAYDEKKEDFTPLKNIPPGNATFIKKGQNGKLWVISDWTIYSYDKSNEKAVIHNLKNNQARSLIIDKTGNPWITTSSGQVKRFDKKSGAFTDVPMPRIGLSKKPLFAMRILPVGDSALIVCDSARAYHYNYRRGKVNELFSAGNGNRYIFTYSIFQSGATEFWLATESGVFIVNIASKSVQHLRKSYTDPYALADDGIRAIYRDKEGGNWIGTFDGGINYNHSQYQNFTKYFPQPGKNSLSGNVIHEITREGFNNLWIGTEDAGLNSLDLKTGLFSHFIPSEKKGFIGYKNIQGLLADGDRLWIGTSSRGLDLMDLKTRKVIRRYRKEDHKSGITDNFIITIYRTRKGEILAGTGSGLIRYDRKKDNFAPVPFFNRYLQAIHESADGTLWACTYGFGILYRNTETGVSGQLNYSAKKDQGLLSKDVNGIFEDSKGSIWFCTEGGLSRFNPRTKIFRNFGLKEGLPDARTFRILEDSYGFLWIATGKGLARFNPRDNTFTAYHTTDGLPTEQFNFNSSFKDLDGTMYFGTLRGMISFRPETIVKNNFVPPVYITSLQINNKDVVASTSGPLRLSVIHTKKLVLPYDLANITLDVASLSYISPKSNHYRYKMDGIDSTWVELTAKRKIYYTNLPPGDYLFRVKGSNNDGLWNRDERTMLITIRPPFWKTVWAYLFYALLAGGILFIIYRYNALALSEKNKRRIETIKMKTEREIYSAKIEFFTNIAHELRTPLTLIKMPLEKIINEIYDHPNLNLSLAMIQKNTDRLIDLTDQLLDFRKTEANSFRLTFTKTDINELLNEVYDDFKLHAQSKGIDYQVEVPKLITVNAYVDREALKKIFVNLINNAVKYASSVVKVKLMPLNTEDEVFNIEIQNDGFIIPDRYLEKIFEPFFRIKETESETGTGIGLPLARSLALLHKGNISLRTTEVTNIFRVSIPMHQEQELHIGDREELLQVPESPRQEISGSSDAFKFTVLLVEDNRDILNYMFNELSLNYTIIKAENGTEALDVLDKENIHLVISDIMMPVMDGIELCKRMKTDLLYCHVPIILLTAKNSLTSKIQGLDVGADAYIEKPFSFSHLIAQMNSLLSNRNRLKNYFAHAPLAHIKGIASSKADADFLTKFNKMIESNILDTALDVEKLSSLMNMSRPTLYRKIKSLSDMTPNELINLTRLKKAAELLAEGTYKVNEVAFMIGYPSHANFSRDFQRQFDMSPTGFILGLKASPVRHHSDEGNP